MTNTKNYRHFIILWLGEMISAIGGGLTSFGLGVYIFNKTGSASSMAIVTLVAFLPSLLLSVPAGVLADKYDRRLLMMIGDGLSGLGILYIVICMMTSGASLLQICIGAFISSAFSALMDPSYKATVTDLLTKEEYSKASGLVSIAGSARYLISPIIAALLLIFFDIKILMIIDICTFFLTVATTAFVKRSIVKKESTHTESFAVSFKIGWKTVTQSKGIMVLIIITSLINLFMGAIQVLSEPMILSIGNSTTLGIGETVCASGMLITGVALGIFGIKKGYVKVLFISLLCAGVSMFFFGLFTNIVTICIAGFLFFASLPLANCSLDYLVRSNIKDELQGRVWGLISFISQIGCIIAFASFGFLADISAKAMNTDVGRGCGFIIKICGILLALSTLLIIFSKEVKQLENPIHE